MNKIRELLPITIKTGLVFTILIYPIGFTHELGHYLVGHYNGSQCNVNYFELIVNCEPAPQPSWFYFSLGGIFGMVASLALLAIKKLRCKIWVSIGTITMAFDQLVKATYETLIHPEYLNSSATFWYMGLLVGSFFLLLIITYPRVKNKT